MYVCICLSATETAYRVTKCTTDIKFGESDAALDIFYPPSSKGI